METNKTDGRIGDEERKFRGGSWINPSDYCREHDRISDSSNVSYIDLSLRLVLKSTRKPKTK